MISASRYKIIADFINNAQDRGSDITGYLSDMSSTLSSSEILSTSNDRQRLEDQISVTSDLMSSRHQFYTSYMTNFVFVLQKYIDDNYSTIDDFLANNNTQVLPVFADLSEAVGYPIDAVNIENIS